MRVAHDAAMGTLTGPYPVAEFRDDLMRVTKGETDEALADLTLERSKELWDYLEAQGVRFQPSLGGTLSLGRTNAFFLGGGRSMLNALYRTAEDAGVEIRYDTPCRGYRDRGRLLRRGDVGERLAERPRRPDPRRGPQLRRRRAGGFEANIEWLKEAWGPARRELPHSRHALQQGPRAAPPPRRGRALGRRP